MSRWSCWHLGLWQHALIPPLNWETGTGWRLQMVRSEGAGRARPPRVLRAGPWRGTAGTAGTAGACGAADAAAPARAFRPQQHDFHIHAAGATWM